METELAPLNGQAFWRSVVEALPAAVLVVDQDRRLVALNRWAEQAFGVSALEALERRPGDILSCLHSARSPEGCGHTPACADCELRRAAEAVLSGQTLSQREVPLTISEGTEVIERFFLLSASPVPDHDHAMAILMLQDVTDLHRLRGLVPICASCKKIRRDDQAWVALELFIESHSHAQFTHGLCPECIAKFYPDLATGNEPELSRRTIP